MREIVKYTRSIIDVHILKVSPILMHAILITAYPCCTEEGYKKRKEVRFVTEDVHKLRYQITYYAERKQSWTLFHIIRRLRQIDLEQLEVSLYCTEGYNYCDCSINFYHTCMRVTNEITSLQLMNYL